MSSNIETTSYILEDIIDIDTYRKHPIYILGYMSKIDKTIDSSKLFSRNISRKLHSKFSNQDIDFYISVVYDKDLNAYYIIYYNENNNVESFKITKDSFTFLPTSIDQKSGTLLVHDIEIKNVMLGIDLIKEEVGAEITSIIFFSEEDTLRKSIIKFFIDKIPSLESIYLVTFDDIKYKTLKDDVWYEFI